MKSLRIELVFEFEYILMHELCACADLKFNINHYIVKILQRK